MLNVEITKGAIYHIQSKKRHEFEISKSLRELTNLAIREIRYNLVNNIVPEVPYSKICDRCSLYSLCLPKRKYVGNPFQPVKING